MPRLYRVTVIPVGAGERRTFDSYTEAARHIGGSVANMSTAAKRGYTHMGYRIQAETREPESATSPMLYCPSCREYRERRLFYPTIYRSSGASAYCMECIKIKQKGYRDKRRAQQ